MRAFGDRLADAFDAYGALCVGIDPHPYLLEAWNLPDTAHGAREFGLRIVAAASTTAGLVKPQVAFFERFGSAGYEALEAVISAARDAGLMVIADAKRSDIGSSMAAYAQAWLQAGAALEADAVTVSPYLGVGSLAETIRLARSAGKGVFVLAATSNPEGAALQKSGFSSDGYTRTLARAIIEDVGARNQEETRPIGSVGVVLGATADLREYGIDSSAVPGPVLTPVLAPGFGHQGARVEDAGRIFQGFSQALIVTESRGLAEAGPADLTEAISRRADEVREALASARTNQGHRG